MKINKTFICLLMALMLLFCVNAVSAEDTFNTELASNDAGEPIAIESVDEISANEPVDDALAADSGSNVLKATGKTKYIDCSYNGTIESGTEDQPYKTIRTAASLADDGDIFIIKNGEYTTDNSIKVSGFRDSTTFIGESRGGVIIKSTEGSYSFVNNGAGLELTLINLTFVLQPTGSSYSTPFKLNNAKDATLNVINCSVVDSKLSKLAELKNYGSVLFENLTVSNCTFYGGGNAVIHSGSPDKTITIKNSIIDNSQFDPSSSNTLSSVLYQQGTSNSYPLPSAWIVDNLTISNSNFKSSYGLVDMSSGEHTFDMVNSKFENNTVTGSSNGLFYVAEGTINVQQSVISNNTAAALFSTFYSSSQGYTGTIIANYNNIRDNTLSGTITTVAGDYDLDDNWWGSNQAPTPADLGAGNSLNTWAVDTGNNIYKIYDNATGETSFLEKAIPELPVPEPVGSSVVIDPIAAVEYGDDVVITYTVENETTLDIVVKDSTGAAITSGVDISVPGQVTVSNLIPGDYTIDITNEAETYVEPSSANATFTVDKAGSNVEINHIDTVKYPNDVIVTYNVENETTVSAVVRDSKGAAVTTGIDTSVSGQVTISGLGAGEYTIEITNEESDLYVESYATSTFKVSKATTTITVSADNITYGESLIVNVELPSDVSRRATVTVDGVSKYVTLKNGVGSVKFDGLARGNYTVVATYSGDANYGKATNSIDIEVTKGVTTIDITSQPAGYGDTLIVDVQLPSAATGTVEVAIGDAVQQATLVDGSASVGFDGLEIGSHTVTVSYSGDDNFDPATASATVKVTKPVATIEITADDITYGESLVVSVKMPSDVSRRPLVTVDGDASKYVTMKNGVGSVKFDGLAIGTHTIVVTYAGDTKYYKTSNTTTVEVTKGVADIEITADSISYGETLTVDVQLPSDATGTVEVAIGDEVVNVTLVNGHASVDFDGLSIGTHTITVSYSGDDNYAAGTASAKVKVTRAVPDIQVTADNITYGEQLVVNVQMPSDVTRRATVTIDGETKYVTLKNGVGSVKFSGLEVGEHDVVVSYAGDSNYAAASETIQIAVTE